MALSRYSCGTVLCPYSSLGRLSLYSTAQCAYMNIHTHARRAHPNVKPEIHFIETNIQSTAAVAVAFAVCVCASCIRVVVQFFFYFLVRMRHSCIRIASMSVELGEYSLQKKNQPSTSETARHHLDVCKVLFARCHSVLPLAIAIQYTVRGDQ